MDGVQVQILGHRDALRKPQLHLPVSECDGGPRARALLKACEPRGSGAWGMGWRQWRTLGHIGTIIAGQGRREKQQGRWQGMRQQHAVRGNGWRAYQEHELAGHAHGGRSPLQAATLACAAPVWTCPSSAPAKAYANKIHDVAQHLIRMLGSDQASGCAPVAWGQMQQQPDASAAQMQLTHTFFTWSMSLVP